MSVFRRGKNSKVYHYRFMIDGKLERGSTKETTLAKARQMEALIMGEIRKGERNPHMQKSPLLSEFAPKFLAHIDKQETAGNLAHKTVLSYRNGCRLLSATPVWGMRLGKITRAEASELSFPGSGSNANQALRTLRRLLSYAEERQLLRAVPRIDLREEHGRDRVLEPWMEALILKHASPVLRDVITIMLDCGMRPEEVGRMEWAHIRWNENTVLVPHGKSFSARRFVGLTERMRDTLEGAQARNVKWKKASSPYVFPSNSKSEHVQNFTSSWARTIERANKRSQERLPDDIVLYSCRHTFATQFLRNGGDIGTLCRLMGHSSITTTQKYLHLVEAGGTAQIMNAHNERKLRLVKSA